MFTQLCSPKTRTTAASSIHLQTLTQIGLLIGYNMGRTRERAWRNTDTGAPKKKLNPKQKISYMMRKTKECAWRKKNTRIQEERAWRIANIEIPKKKLEPMQMLLDDDGDVDLLVPKQKHCELVENVSSKSNSLLDDDDDDDDDVVILDPKQEQCGLSEKVSPMSNSVLAEASKKIFSSVTSKRMDVIDDDDSLEWVQALEPVKNLPTNVGARIKRCIYESLNRNPPEWAKEILVYSISKEVYKGNASGATKRAVISVLEKVRIDIFQPHPPEKKEKEKSGVRTSYEEELLDDDGDVDLLDAKQKHCGLVENVSSRSNSLLDDDDDVVILDPKQEQCGLSEKVSPMSNSLLDDDVEPLTLKQEHSDLGENLSPMSDSLEKYSSCQSGMVSVQGYKVKQSIATILEAIFKKHGDIAANCVFKASSTRTHFLEVVCEVVKKIQTNDLTEMVKDIECQVLDAEAANINVSWIRAYFESFHKRKETSKNYNLLMNMKSNTILVKRAAQVDLRETCEELMAAQERFKNAERCVRVLHLVEKSLHDNILESKDKLESWVKQPIV